MIINTLSDLQNAPKEVAKQFAYGLFQDKGALDRFGITEEEAIALAGDYQPFPAPILPDYVSLEPVVVPDWANWQLLMLQDEKWNQVAAQGGHLVSALYVLISQVQNSPATLGNIAGLFGMLTASVPQEQKQIWADWAKTYNLPDDFVSAIVLD
jgi:hypothetical protein